MKAKMMRNVELVSLAIDEAGFASLRIRDRDTGDVYTVPGGYPTRECSWCVVGAALDQPCVCPEPCGFAECLRDPEIRKRVMKAAFPLSNGKTWTERRNDAA